MKISLNFSMYWCFVHRRHMHCVNIQTRNSVNNWWRLFYRQWQCEGYCSCVIIIPETLSFRRIHLDGPITFIFVFSNANGRKPTWILYASLKFAKMPKIIWFNLNSIENKSTIQLYHFLFGSGHLTKECVSFFPSNWCP